MMGCILTNGFPLTWGQDSNSSTVATEFATLFAAGDSVVDLIANRDAWAILTANGAVVTWGDNSKGGNSSIVSSSLQSGVVEVVASKEGFAAALCNGKVVSWGNVGAGGNLFNDTVYLTGGVGAGCTVAHTIHDECYYCSACDLCECPGQDVHLSPVNGTVIVEEEEEGFPVWAIVIIAVGAALVVGVSIIVIWKCACKPKVNKIGEWFDYWI